MRFTTSHARSFFKRGAALSLALLFLSTTAAPARPAAEGADKPFVVEYYYKAK